MVDHCKGCPFGGRTCGARGNPEAPLIIIGESPGANELAKGEPFIGESGKLLDKTLLKTFGFDSHDSQVYVTNALFCRPPKSSNSAPPADALWACRPRVLEDVFRSPRKLILALGNSALRSLEGNYKLGITRERGNVHTVSTDAGTLAVLPTFHPAAILRKHTDYPKLVEDFEYAARIFREGTSGIKSPGETKHIVITEALFDQCIAGLMKQPVLAVDIETTGFDPLRDQIITVGICWQKNKVVVFPSPLVPRLKEFFEAYTGRLIWHNGKFDTSFLHEVGIPAKVHGDTLLAHYTLSEIGPHGLKELSTVYLGQRNYRAELTAYLPNKKASFALIPKNVLYPYMATDCDGTYQLRDIFETEIDADPALAQMYYKLLIPASNFLRKVERRGVPVSLDKLHEVRELLQRQKEELLSHIADLVTGKQLWDPDLYATETKSATTPTDFLPSSPKQLAWIIYRQLKLRPPKGTPSDTRVGTLLQLPRHPLITIILRYRSVAKLLSTYIDGIERRIGADGRIHSTYLLHGTTTGRLASRNPNMQNIPRQGPIKSIFVTPPGRQFISIDHSQAELRVLAALSQDPELMRVYYEGRDLHDEVSLKVFGPGFSREQRVRTKFLNFGIAYGRGAKSIADEFKIPIPEAQEMIDSWYTAYPVAGRYIDRCRSAPARGVQLQTVFGRRRRFELITPENRNAIENEAINFPISSTASDLTLSAAMTMDSYLEANDAYIINLVHDSIVIDAPEDFVTGVCKYAIEVMEDMPRRILKTDMPFAAEAEIGSNLAELHKFARAVA